MRPQGTAEFPKEIRLTLPMMPEVEVTATHTAEAVARLMAFAPDQIDELKHALVEACINAFEHSQSQDDQIYIRFVMREEELEIVIQDHGKGFDPGAVPKPDLHTQLAGGRKRGWGLLLIENLMDSVQVVSDEQGTTLAMCKRRRKAPRTEGAQGS